MAGKLTKLALLTAGLFLSSDVRAEFECVALAGSVVVNLEFQNSATCPDISSKQEGTSLCELVRYGDFVCVGASGSASGGPWRYTGAVYEEEEPEEPEEPTNPTSDIKDAASVVTNFNNDFLADGLSNFTAKMAEALDVVTENQRTQQVYHYWTRDKLNEVDHSSDIINSTTGRTEVRLNQLDNRVENFVTLSLADNEKQLLEHEETQTKIDELDTKVDESIIPDLAVIKNSSDNAQYWSLYANGNASEANYYAQQANNAAQEAASWSVEAAHNASSAASNTNDILVKLWEMSEGGDDGSGGGSSQTNDILTSIKTDANNNTNRVVDAVNNSTALNTLNIELQGTNSRLDSLNSAIGYNHSGLSNQLGQQLNSIKLAIENSGGSVGDTVTHDKLDTLTVEASTTKNNTATANTILNQIYGAIGAGDSVAHTKLDAISAKVGVLNESVIDAALNTTQAVTASGDALTSAVADSTDQLTAKLDELKAAIESGSGTGGGTGDTITHSKLDTLISKSTTLNENVVDSALNTQQAITASGQGITAAVDGLGAKLDGIQDAIENGSGLGGDTVTHGKLDSLTGSVDDLGQQLEGIGESLDGLSDVMQPGTGQNSGPTLCTGQDCWKQKSWVQSSFPDGVQGLWDERKDAFDRSAMKGYLDSFVPSLQAGAIDPFQLCFNLGFYNYGCHSFSIPDYVIAFLRLVILISAGFYCQRLVFGGA